MPYFDEPDLIPELPLEALRKLDGFAIAWRDDRPSRLAGFYRLPESLRRYLVRNELEQEGQPGREEVQPSADRLYQTFLRLVNQNPVFLEWLLGQAGWSRDALDFEALFRRATLFGAISPEPPSVSVAPKGKMEQLIHKRSMYWTTLLLVVGHDFLSQTMTHSAYPIEVAVGFLDSEHEAEEFGLAIYVSEQDLDEMYLPSEPTRLENLPALERGDISLPSLLGWGGHQGGPLIVRREPGFVEPHKPPGYGGASSASFVCDSISGLPLGVLGCEHVLPNPSVGAGVPMRGHPAQQVVRIQHLLDLAVVTSPIRVPNRRRKLQRWPAQWLPCDLKGEVSSILTRVVQISNQWGVFSDPRLPVHVDLEHSGTHGDSGGEVVDITTGGFMGVYIGAIQSRGPAKGRAVHIQQIESVMGLELVE